MKEYNILSLEKTATVHVTEEAIARNKHRCDDCPIFDGMRDAGVPVAKVHHSVWVDSRDGYHEFPQHVKDWVCLYDLSDHYTVASQPFSFEVSWEEL